MSSAPLEQNLNISKTMKEQTSGISAQTSTNEAQTNDRIHFSKFQSGLSGKSSWLKLSYIILINKFNYLP
jgi:hypothetical protein